MADFPLGGGTVSATIGADTTATAGTTLTSGAANTKGSYAQLVASSRINAFNLFLIIGGNQSTTLDEYLIDIAIGAAASEQVIIANIPWGRQTEIFIRAVPFSISIPAGVRISARCQCTSATKTIQIMGILVGRGLASPAGNAICTTYGAATADSGGVSVDPGAVADTKGAYSEITASTTARARELIIAFGGRDNSARSICDWLVDIAIGAGGSEQVIISNIHLYAQSSDDALELYYVPLPLGFPEGVRLSARAQCSITDATDRLFDVIVFGMG